LKENVIIGRLIPTLQYFENNRNVGEFFGGEGEEEPYGEFESPYSRAKREELQAEYERMIAA
jgi:hypothetical protein